jgi:hypothetical protein
MRADKADDRLAGWREPKLYTGIDNLVRGGVPTIAENQFAGSPESFGVKADFVSRRSHAATVYQSGCCPAPPGRDFTQTAGAFWSRTSLLNAGTSVASACLNFSNCALMRPVRSS